MAPQTDGSAWQESDEDGDPAEGSHRHSCCTNAEDNAMETCEEEHVTAQKGRIVVNKGVIEKESREAMRERGPNKAEINLHSSAAPPASSAPF